MEAQKQEEIKQEPVSIELTQDELYQEISENTGVEFGKVQVILKSFIEYQLENMKLN